MTTFGSGLLALCRLALCRLALCSLEQGGLEPAPWHGSESIDTATLGPR